MRILALVAARGASKRLPGKNIRELGGRPLVVWTINVAKDIESICDILASTDDATTAAICEKAGAFVPWLRPAELATDTASSVDVALHALDWYESEKGVVDGLLLLQPTSPFRTRETVRKGIELFKRGDGQRPVVGVSPSETHPMWIFKIQDNYLQPLLRSRGSKRRSQDLPPAFVLNGSLYLVPPSILRAERSFLGPQTTPLIVESKREALDIDDEWDWSIALTLATSCDE